MATAQVQRFAARHGVRPEDIFTPAADFGSTHRSGKLQNELSHYERGWGAFAEGHHGPAFADEKQAYAAAHENYQKMIAWNASMGRVTRQEYVNGYVDAWLESHAEEAPSE